MASQQQPKVLIVVDDTVERDIYKVYVNGKKVKDYETDDCECCDRRGHIDADGYYHCSYCHYNYGYKTDFLHTCDDDCTFTSSAEDNDDEDEDDDDDDDETTTSNEKEDEEGEEGESLEERKKPQQPTQNV